MDNCRKHEKWKNTNIKLFLSSGDRLSYGKLLCIYQTHMTDSGITPSTINVLSIVTTCG